jgi:tRNA(Ile)-lysidine synthase
MSSITTSLVAKLTAAWPPDRWRDVTVLVAVSGGADSVALVRALTQIRASGEGRLVLAYFNHRLRGAESDADEAFVGQLANRLGLRLIVGQAAGNLAAGGSGEGIEGAARQARYDFLTSAANECGARYVATAHTADDQVETVLLNLLRGTGLAGLAGIPRLRKLTDAATIVRPLLDVTRCEVLDYLQMLHQPYRDDSTNRLEDYTRNRIRLQLLPLLERDYNPRVREALLRLAQNAGQAEDFLDQQAESALAAAARRIAGGIEIVVRRIAHLHPALIRYALRIAWQEQGWPLQDMSLEKWEQLRAVVQATVQTDETAAQVFPGGIRAQRDANTLRLTRPDG